MRSSRLVLATAVAVLAVTGGAVALTTAGAAPASPFTVTNGSIRTATGTPSPPSGTHASLWGATSTAAVTLEGSGRVVLGAVGDHCVGWPTVRVTVDGARTGDTTIVSAARYGAYPVGQAVAAGRHAVVISFVNDHRTATCDRNVHVGFARMENAATAPAPTSAAPTSAAPTTAAPSPTRTTPTASPTAVPVGRPGTRPGAANTGVPDGTRLTVHEGDLVITRAGTVVDATEVRGNVIVRAGGVVIRRSLIRGDTDTGRTGKALVTATGTQRGLLIEDSTISARTPDPWQNGIQGHEFTLRRVDISRVVDTAMIFGNNVFIHDSWFHDLSYFTPFSGQPDNQTHNDALQIEGGTNIVVQGNVFEGAHNAAIMVTQNVYRTSGVRITRNWLSGGGCTVNLAEKGKGPILDFRLSGNRFGLSRLANCPVIAPPTSQVTLDGDVWDATGLPITIRRGS